jgi:hypothetical protein
VFDAEDCFHNEIKPRSTERKSTDEDQQPDHDVEIPTTIPIHPALPEAMQVPFSWLKRAWSSIIAGYSLMAFWTHAQL